MKIPDLPGGGPIVPRPGRDDARPELVLDNVRDLGLERSMGQVIPARVSFLMGDKAVLEVQGRFVLAEAHVPMGAGDQLMVRVKSYDGERAVLQLVDQKERAPGQPTMRQDISGLLQRFGLKGTPEEKALATATLEYGFGLDEKTFKAMLTASDGMPMDQDRIQALMFARAHRVPITAATSEAVETWLTQQPRMGDHVQQTLTVLRGLGSALAAIGVDAPLAEGLPPPRMAGHTVVPVVAAEGSLAVVAQGIAGNTPQSTPQPGAMVVPPGAEGAQVQPGTVVPQDADAPVPPQGQAQPGTSQPQQPGTAPPQDADSPALPPAPMPLPPGVTPQVHGLALSLRAAFATGEAGPGFNSAAQLHESLGQLTEALQAFTVGPHTDAATVKQAVQAVTTSLEHQLVAARSASSTDPLAGVDALMKSDLSTEEIVQQLLQPLNPNAPAAARPDARGDALMELTRLRDALELLAQDAAFSGRDNPAFKSLLEATRNIGGLLDTQRFMNASMGQRDERGAAYLAIPFALPGNPFPEPSEVRIYPPPQRKGGKRARMEELKVTFYINTPRMGRMKIDMGWQGGAVHFHFLVSNADVRSHLQDKSVHLRRRLEEHAVKVGRMDLAVGEVPSMARSVDRQTEVQHIKKLGKLDLRA